MEDDKWMIEMESIVILSSSRQTVAKEEDWQGKDCFNTCSL